MPPLLPASDAESRRSLKPGAAPVTGKLTTYYYDPVSQDSFIIVQDDRDVLYLLTPRFGARIPQLSPNAHRMARNAREFRSTRASFPWVWKSFGSHDPRAFPSEAHGAPLLCGFRSRERSVYLLEGGASILFRRRETLDDCAYAWEKCFDVAYLSPMDGAYENFSLEALLEHPDFEPMDWYPDSKEGLYPLEGGFIIEPGACVQNKIEDLSRFPLHEIESPRSVDFVHLSFSWEEFPEEWRPFRELPAALAERLGARFDRAAWERAMLCGAEIRMEQGPPCVHPLFCGSDCVAEFSLMGGMGSGEPHYEDSDAIMLRYAPCAEEAVQQLLRELAEAHPTLRRLRSRP